MYSKRFEELKATGLLPSPTGIGLEILRLSRSEKASAQDIARVMQADPALTGRTLRLANTGNAAASRPVTNVVDAVARLGMRTVNAIALGFTILAGNRAGRCRGFDYSRFWAHSLAYAVASQILSAHTRPQAGADAFTAGLLAQIGRLALASIHAEKYALVLSQWSEGSPDDLLRLEQKTFVTDHNELSSVMLADWGLPKEICEAVLHQENPLGGDLSEGGTTRQLARTLHAASCLADICVAATDAQAAALTSDLLQRSQSAGINSDTIAALFDRVFSQWTEWGQVLEISTRKPPKLSELIEAARLLDAPAGADPASALPAEFDAAPSPAASDPTAAESDEPSPGLVVLVADEDVASLRFLEKFLSLSGHRVRCATSGREALQVFFETAPQLVIADAGLSDVSGVELCRRLRQTVAGRQSYIIVLVPPEDDDALAHLFDAGADDFVTKPFAARPFFARIRACLRVIALQNKVSEDQHEIQRIHSELAVAHRRLEQDALTDVLTGLPNRRYLIDRLAHDWAAARRSGTPLACMMIDIDRFKSVNDTYGHDVGDFVLQAVAEVLQREVRGTDVVCRLGGEEFVVVSPTDFESALRGAERLRASIEERVVGAVTAIKGPVTVSIGVAVRNEQIRSAEALIKAADEALFCAKRGGRNRVAGNRERMPHAPPAGGARSAGALAESLVAGKSE